MRGERHLQQRNAFVFLLPLLCALRCSNLLGGPGAAEGKAGAEGQTVWEEKDSLHRDQSIGGQAQASNLLGGQERGGQGLRGRQCGKRGTASPEIRALEGRLRIQPAWKTGEGRAGFRRVVNMGTSHTL